MHDDFAPPASEWEPPEHELLKYVLVKDGPELIGLFMVAKHSHVMWELHEAFLPSAWGRRARRAAREFREWIWGETKCQRLIGTIVASNRAALAFAKASGMEIVGVHPRSFMKHGRLQDLIIVGLSRPMEIN